MASVSSLPPPIHNPAQSWKSHKLTLKSIEISGQLIFDCVFFNFSHKQKQKNHSSFDSQSKIVTDGAVVYTF